jgi:hypothetical protein
VSSFLLRPLTRHSAAAMIPPVAPAVLVSNPKFEKAHQHLTENMLDVDASTKAANASQKPTDDLLHAERSQIAEHGLLIASMFEICGSDDVPKELRDLVLLIASYISDSRMLGLTRDEHALMTGDTEYFRRRIDEIAEALTKKLNQQYDVLAKVVSAANDSLQSTRISSRDARYVATSSRDPTDLGTLTESLTTQIQRLRSQTLPSAQHKTGNALISLLKSQTEHIQCLIRHLEQRRHGAEARHLVTRAQFLSAVAQGLEAKTRVAYLEQRRDVYSPQLRLELASKMRELEEEEDVILERRRKLQAALDEYEFAGGDVLRTLGGRYGEIGNEIEEVKGDLERLEKQRTDMT